MCWVFLQGRPLLTFWRKQLIPCKNRFAFSRFLSFKFCLCLCESLLESLQACLVLGIVGSLLANVGFSLGNCDCEMTLWICCERTGKKLLIIYFFCKSIKVIIVATMRRWELKLPYNRNKLKPTVSSYLIYIYMHSVFKVELQSSCVLFWHDPLSMGASELKKTELLLAETHRANLSYWALLKYLAFAVNSSKSVVD